MKEFIEIRGAKTHNLKNLDIDIPLGKIVGIAGVSGSGKSSLALDVLYAEGSRRYLDALSTYTRRRIKGTSKPDIDSIRYMPASLALHQRPNIPNIRSTFGTMTELSNQLRLLYSRCGNYKCPNCGKYLEPTLAIARDQYLVCDNCHHEFMGLSAEEYAFNSDGACPACQGTGVVLEVDDSTLVPDENKTLEQGAVRAWNMFGISWMYRTAGVLGVRVDVPFKDLTAKEKEIVYHGKEQDVYTAIPSKSGKLFDLKVKYRNAHRAVEEALKGATTDKGFEKINQYLKSGVCPECNGSRLNKRAMSTLLGGKNIEEASEMTLQEIYEWIPTVIKGFNHEIQQMAKTIVAEFMNNTEILLNLGLSYISLNRQGSTLSTGELQRVQLAKTVRNHTTGVLYVLDEPSIGLHPSNVDGLIQVVKELVKDGNSVVLVDHDVRILNICDYIIEMGPRSGQDGGNIIAKGNISEVIKDKDTLIGGFLSNKEEIIVRNKADKSSMFNAGHIALSTNEIHGVKPMDVDIPKNRLTVITGESGAGKTTLILEALIPGVESTLNKEKLPEEVKSIKLDNISKISLIDASPIGINIRSTVATYTGILDDLRKVYAGLESSKEHKYTASSFSYNTGNLRCHTCDGTGSISMDIQFLPDLDLPCPDCGGNRYAPEAEDIKYNEMSISEVLNLNVSEALEKLKDIKKVKEKLEILNNLGLGYLALGEATTELSGGEAQRLKLASEMGKTENNSIYVFDEPTIGLHPLDVRDLLSQFDKLLENGATVIVIEHDLDFINNADYVVDITPKRILEGVVEDIKSSPDSITGKYL